MCSWNACSRGESTPSLAFLETVSTASSKPCESKKSGSGLFTCGMKRLRPSWPALTPSSPADSASALRPPGPGGIHLLNGLYDAKMDQAPVLAITGMQHSDLIGTFTQQDVALDKLFIDVAVYNERVMNGAHMESVADLAIRTALAKRGVAHITIPVDVQVQESQERPLGTQPDASYVGGSGLFRSDPRARGTGARRRHPESREEDRNPGRTRRSARHRGTGGDGGKTRSAHRQSLCSEKPACRMTAPTPPEASAFSEPNRRRTLMEGVRHASDGGNLFPLHRISPRTGNDQVRADRYRPSADQSAPACRCRPRG